MAEKGLVDWGALFDSQLQQPLFTLRKQASKYRDIPCENIKFQKFIDLLFSSTLTKEEVKDEIKQYVKALETGYMEWIEEMKKKGEKEWRIKIFKES